MRLALTLSFISSLCLTMTVAVAISLARPGCQESCGNITIPYPFGIGPECSANSSFLVTCQNSTNPPSLFLNSTNFQVRYISLRDSTIEVTQPVSPLNCSTELRTQILGQSLQGSPFTISAVHNSMAVLGCRNSVWLRPNETATTGGCMAICDENSTDTSCNGVNCCQTTIPPRLQELRFTYQSTGVNNNSRFCGYAFLAQPRWFQEDYRAYNGLHNDLLNPFDQNFVNATTVLEWGFDDPPYSSHYSCEYRGQSSSSFTSSSFTRLCHCAHGFEGNPYLPVGCQDIDECSNPRTNSCPNSCVNRVGYYTCGGSSNKSRARIAFICVGSGLGALLLLLGTWRSMRAVRERIKANRKRKFFKRNGGLLLQQELSSTDNNLEKTKLFSSKELAQATDHYNENRILGRGGQGTVYKGMLTDGRIVAVKKSKRVDEGDLEVFINEVVILSQINHRNVVKLLGCCLETDVPILVYEFVPNGTLFQHIHDPNEEFPLSWEMRLRIATEIAGALAYLHSAASTPIYHRDIKSTNILLDDKYRSKVSDFGTSRSIAIDQTHLTTRVLGTFGYLDPEYFQSSQFTEKSDVYSFGVVMVELLTGEKAVSLSVRSDVGRSLATHFLHSMEEGQLFEILDPKVLDGGTREQTVAIAKLARRCLHLNGKMRPTMKEVTVELQGIRMLKEGSGFQEDGDDREFLSIQLDESCDFSSISESNRIDTTSTYQFDAEHPLLVEP